ncbi:type II toxin-antitoxin system VapC family toxin [Actinomyces slackii]|uniref:Ribonuclease VapC n=2 Tax=Actinomyces slackii TaxID=52774 RepID=A0A448KDA6_9ACTO|nr:type II toxin-antitoxin system VapC family toxin [Actinomyces slackii]VEG74914.1 Probable ribonuclease VapC32 [Actinomyces slackii]
MILIDTNVWIDHLHVSDNRLVALLERDEAATHEAVLTELALGSIKNREKVLNSLGSLRRVPQISDCEVRWFTERRRLWGRGLSAVDVHLLASVVAERGALLWTRDKRLAAAADELGVGYR